MITKPCKLQDPEKVLEIVNNYFQDRKDKQEVRELKNGDIKIYREPPTIIGLCRYLNISTDAFDDYLNNENAAYNKEISGILRDAKDRIITELIEGVSQGYWTEKIVLAMLTRYGVIGNEQEEKTFKIIMQGSNDWSR